jgi:hypothetical protein
MTLAFTLPFGEKGSVKDLVFSILSHEYPLKIIELTNLIRKRYGKSVTFQAVRKAVLALVAEGVLHQEGHAFSIRLEWVRESKGALDLLYHQLSTKARKPTSIDAAGGEISVFTFQSLNDLMKFWEDLVEDWIKKFKKGDPNINTYQGFHPWEGLLHPDRERIIWSTLIKKGVKSYSLITSNTPLDVFAIKLYKSIGLKTAIRPPNTKFDQGLLHRDVRPTHHSNPISRTSREGTRCIF